MKYCTKCLYPETKPQLNFDQNGVCDACQWSETKNSINWNERKEELKKTLEKYRNKDNSNYDCIIPVSGGRDSHFQTYVILKEYGMNPLLVNFHPQDITEIGKKTSKYKDIHGQYMGLMKFKPKGWLSFKECLKKEFNNNFDNLYLTDVFQKLIEKMFFIKASKYDRKWAEVDSKKDYLIMKKIFKD